MANTVERVTVTTRIADVPFMIVGGIAASCLIGALVCDIVYIRDPDFKWVTFSVWLITVGLIVGLIALLVGIVDRLQQHRFGTVFRRWPYLLGFVAAAAVSIINAFVHSRDAYEAVVPDGIVLSAVAVLLLVLTPWFARTVSRNRPVKTLP